VLPKLGFIQYNEENIRKIVNYIFTEIDGPLANVVTDEGSLTKQEKELLDIAFADITEITTRSD